MPESADSSSVNVLVGNLWVLYRFDDPNERYKQFQQIARPALKQLIESVLLHDQIVLPTQDFMSLTLLLDVLGEQAVLDLLEAHCLKFIRVLGALCYVGNGGGIQPFHIGKEDQPQPFCAPTDQAIAWAISGLRQRPTHPQFQRLVQEATVSELSFNTIADDVRHETYMDVLNSKSLRDAFALRNTDMRRLAGVGPRDVRIYGGVDVWKGDEIDTVLALAHANVELRLAELSGCSDSSTASPVGHILNAKAERTLGELRSRTGYIELCQIAEVPDVGEGVLMGQTGLRDLVKLRESRGGKQFRDWFHKNCRVDTLTTAKEYSSLMRTIPKIQSLPARVMRFIVTTALGAVPGLGTLLGPPVSLVDSFFVNDLLRGRSPKFFIDDLRQLGKNSESA